LVKGHAKDSILATALEKDVKGMVSVVVYVISIPLAFWNGWVAMAAYLAVAVMWMVPDNRIERLFGDEA